MVELRKVCYVDADDPLLVDRRAVELWTHGERLPRLTPVEMAIACFVQSLDRCCVPDELPGAGGLVFD